MIRLTIDVAVLDEIALIEFARAAYTKMWGADDDDKTTGEWLFEALVASTPGPLPDGIEIHDWSVREL